MKVNKIGGTLLDALLPNYCGLCDLPSHRNVPLCQACENDLPANRHCCHCCAIPLPPSLNSAGQLLCGTCLVNPPPFDRAIAPWLYSEQLAHLIQRWKYQREQRLTGLLASLWLQTTSPPAPVDLLVPVPLHWWRLCRRGFNQSELLARQLRRRSTAIAPVIIDHKLARRVRATAAQSGMNASQRKRNLRGAFTISRPCDNLRIAIVDDVLTTGATAAALASTLRAGGASYIEIWCLARTPAPAA